MNRSFQRHLVLNLGVAVVSLGLLGDLFQARV